MIDKSSLLHDLEFWKKKRDKYMKKQNNYDNYDNFCTLISIIDRIKEIESEIKNAS